MAQADLDKLTIPGLFWDAVAARGDQLALGVILGGELSWRSWNDLAKQVDALMARLTKLGVGAGDRVVQVRPNCEAWIVADLAIQSVGAVHVPLHATLAVSQMRQQIEHCGARAVLVGDRALADQLAGAGGTGCQLEVDGESPLPRREGTGEGLANVAIEQRSTASLPSAIPPLTPPFKAGGSEGPSSPQPDDLATILYTSGTTGAPRGVMLTQRNLTANAIATTDAHAPPEGEVRLCLLPLSHIYARTCDLYSWIYHGGRLILTESRETVFRDCAIAQPTAMNAVPYFYQKAVDELRNRGGDCSAAALRQLLGGRIAQCLCGGAALAPEVDRFFAERGLPILCGYGLTESSPVISITTRDTYIPGTVGRPLTNLEVHVAGDGELIVRGASVMRGYWQDEAATAAAIRDGWLHTGDLASLDAAGNLRIVGRKKELMVLATGKKVAPTQVEQLLTGSPLVEQACVVGEGRKFLAAIIVPNGDALRREIRRRRLLVWSKHRAVTHPKVIALYRAEIDRCLSDTAHCEQIGAFVLLPRAFSAELGEVTPKLSLRREAIAANFANEIEAMYRSRGTGSGST